MKGLNEGIWWQSSISHGHEFLIEIPFKSPNFMQFDHLFGLVILLLFFFFNKFVACRLLSVFLFKETVFYQLYTVKL